MTALFAATMNCKTGRAHLTELQTIHYLDGYRIEILEMG